MTTPSAILASIAAGIALLILAALAYLQMPATPRRVERAIRVWASPLNLVLYLLVIMAGFLASIGL